MIKIYELFDFQHGNTDILSDIGNVSQEVRHGMWALTPYSVSDGDGVQNESFNSFVMGESKIPPQYLAKQFKECVFNLKETLNRVPNKQKFLENLLILQEYLQKQGELDDENFLFSEQNEISQEFPPVGIDEISRTEADMMANAFGKKFQLGTPSYLGGGGYGKAYRINNNRVLKITTDKSEVTAGLIIMIANPTTSLANVYGVYQIFNTETQKTFYVLIVEEIVNKPREEFIKYSNIINELAPEENYEWGGRMYWNKRFFDYNTLVNDIKFVLTAKPEATIAQIDREKAYKFLYGIINIKKELNELGLIKMNDFFEYDNLGYRSDTLVYFDVGGGFGTEVPEFKPEDVILLPEDFNLNKPEHIDINVVKNVAKKIHSKFPIEKLEYLGSGCFGDAYDIGHNKVLKLTTDKSEALENLDLINKDLKYIAKPYIVFQIKSKSTDKELYAIVLEKLQTNVPELKRRKERLESVFEDILQLNLWDVLDEYYLYGHADPDDEHNIQAYLNKNSEDKEFFDGLLNIVKEIRQYGVESMDYINHENLGYKKDGSLGVFDLGFGNCYKQHSDRPKTIDVGEDGSTKFSTDSDLGQDGFPTYNNTADTSPSIQNNLDANSAMYNEDLEYNHVVGDATDDKFKISEERIKSWMPGAQAVTVKKKCRLAGLGNTSVACNQGDINNLIFTPLKEEVDFEKLNYGVGKDEMISIKDFPLNKLKVSKRGMFGAINNIRQGLPSKTDEPVLIFYNIEKQTFLVEDGYHRVAQAYINGEKTIPVQIYSDMWSDYVANVGDENKFDLKEEVIPFNKDFLGFISPDNQFINVSISNHAKYLASNYYDIHDFHGSYDALFDQAFKDGWVRVVYEYDSNRFMGALALNGYNKERIKEVLKDKFFDMIKYGNNVIYIDYENPKGSDVIKLGNEEGKEKLVNYISEEINSSEVYSDKDALKTLFNNKRDIALIGFGLLPEIYKKSTIEAGFNLIKIDQTDHPDSIDMNIVYRTGNEKNAKRLHDIMKSHGGYVNDQTSEEAREIGKLLEYRDEDIEEYIRKSYSQFPVVPEKTLADYNLADVEMKYAVNEIASLQELPFKKKIEELGGKIYSVGGVVRDEILGKESKDLDILITGIPMDKLEQILLQYGRVNAVGKSFGILKFKPAGETEEIDVAIPRTEKPSGEGGHKGFDIYTDHKLPIEKDLERRDFTINAIAKDAEGNIIDPYGGVNDLKNKIIKVVNPEAFSDDPLRMLRAVQFAARFGFEIEPNTRKMIKDNASKIDGISPERILIEFDKIVKKGDAFKGAFLLKDLGLTSQIFDADAPLYVSRDWDNVQTMGEFIWLLSHHLVDDPAEYYRSWLKGDIDTYKEIKALDLGMLRGREGDHVKLRSIAHNMHLISPQSLNSKILPSEIKNAVQELLSGKYPKSFNELAVNGNDLMNLGLQGKEIGEALRSLLLKVYSDQVQNNKEDLLSALGTPTELNENWDINGKNVNIDFFVDKYEKWNTQGDDPSYKKPSEESVLEFLQNNFEDFSVDEKLKKELLIALNKFDDIQIQYGALMLFFDIPKWNNLINLIDKDDIYEVGDEYGLETEPHVTILYGFHSEVTPDNVLDLYKDKFQLKPIKIMIKNISIFEEEEFDIVKFDVESKILSKMNAVMRKLPNTNTYLEYHAHVTIAYVKKGKGKKYLLKSTKEYNLIGNELVFSSKKEKKRKLKLTQTGVLNEEKKSKYSQTKESIMRSKNIPKEMKEKILKYLGGGSSYHEGGRIHGLKIPKVKGKSFKGVGLGADKDGFYVYTHRARSKSKDLPEKIPIKDIKFIESTG